MAVVDQRAMEPLVQAAVQRDEALRIDERHLGLVPSNELGGGRARIAEMSRLIAEQVDLDALRTLAGQAAEVGVVTRGPAIVETSERVTIGYASDSAFGFYYAGDLEALRAAGADLVPFSPLRDAELPPCDGLFLGGGFPETHMQTLEENAPMRTAVASYIEHDGPVYAECGGLMYLCDHLTWDGNRRKMVGAIPVGVHMHAKPQGRGYVRLRETASHPWPLSAGGGEVIPAHEFHYSALAGIPAGFEFAYRVERGYGLDGEHDGLCYRNLLASYAHLRDTRRLIAIMQQELGVSGDRLIVLVNRFDKKGPAGLSDIQEALDGVLVWTLPNDYQPVAESINLGTPLVEMARSSALARRLFKLANALREPESLSAKERSGWQLFTWNRD